MIIHAVTFHPFATPTTFLILPLQPFAAATTFLVIRRRTHAAATTFLAVRRRTHTPPTTFLAVRAVVAKVRERLEERVLVAAPFEMDVAQHAERDVGGALGRLRTC